MIVKRIPGMTRLLGKSQGYLALPVRDERIHEPTHGPGTPSMVTAWEPTPAELVKLNAGAPVHVRILGSEHPPILVEVGEIPE